MEPCTRSGGVSRVSKACSTCVAMSPFTHAARDVVLYKLVHGLRLFWPDPDLAVATKGALCQARYRLGARPLVACSAVEDVPDSPANVRAFGRHHSERGQSAFPPVQGV